MPRCVRMGARWTVDWCCFRNGMNRQFVTFTLNFIFAYRPIKHTDSMQSMHVEKKRESIESRLIYKRKVWFELWCLSVFFSIGILRMNETIQHDKIFQYQWIGVCRFLFYIFLLFFITNQMKPSKNINHHINWKWHSTDRHLIVSTVCMCRCIPTSRMW